MFIKVNRSGNIGSRIRVTLLFDNLTNSLPSLPAIDGTDYISPNRSIHLGKGQLSANFKVKILPDTKCQSMNRATKLMLDVESDSSVNFTIQNKETYLVIRNDKRDKPGFIGFSTNEVRVFENISAVGLKIQRRGGFCDEVKLHLLTSNDPKNLLSATPCKKIQS